MNKEKLAILLREYNGEIFCFDEISSTNTFAMEKAKEGRECIVIAKRQSEGRGRRGRSFISEEGGLYMSVCLKINEGPAKITHYPVLAALAVSEAIEKLCKVKADIKWPNDIQISGKKVCGILTESVVCGDSCFLVTGVGINVSNEIPDELTSAGTLKELSGEASEMEILAAETALRLFDVYEKGIDQKDELLGRAKERCITIGRNVTALSSGKTGRAVDIDENGALVIELEDKTTESIIFGDVTVQDI